MLAEGYHGRHTVFGVAYRLTRWLLALILAVANGAVCAADTLPDVIDQIRPAIVAVGAIYPRRQPNRTVDPVLYLGTGFVVGNGRQVITNDHVIAEKLDTENNQRLAVFSGRGQAIRVHLARIVRRDKAHDLALLAFDGEPLPALTLGDSDSVREGQRIAFTGYPIGSVLGLYPATHTGIVAAITPIARPAPSSRSLSATQLKQLRNTYDVLQLDAVGYPGNSGSPVYDAEKGEVIGIINSVLVKGSRENAISQPSGISYAVPVQFARRLLQGR